MVKGDEEDLKRKTKEVQMFSEDEDGWSQISTVSGYPKKEDSQKEDAAETRKMPVITEDAKVTTLMPSGPRWMG